MRYVRSKNSKHEVNAYDTAMLMAFERFENPSEECLERLRDLQSRVVYICDMCRAEIPENEASASLCYMCRRFERQHECEEP